MSVTKIIVLIFVLGNSVPRVGSRGGGEEEEVEVEVEVEEEKKRNSELSNFYSLLLQGS